MDTATNDNSWANAIHSQLHLIHQFGWTKLQSGLYDEEHLQRAVLQIAAALGETALGRSNQIIQRLTPKNQDAAELSSLSKKFGLGELPFHVDTSHWTIPGKYIVLSCLTEGQGDVQTLLLDRRRVALTEAELQLTLSGVFFVRNGRNSFYSSIIGLDTRFIRFDPGCMEPQTPEAEKAFTLFSRERVAHLSQPISWRAGDIAIIDNWRILHARGAVDDPDRGRVLLRCIVL